MALTECEMKLAQMEKEGGAMAYEIDGLRVSSAGLLDRKTEMQAEMGAIDQHMRVLLATN